MKPLDKQGRRLFGQTWDRVHHYGTQLVALGYVEHAEKSNLFVRSYRSAQFYADLRGSNVVAIWQDRRPLFYWRFRRDLDRPTAQRIISIEAARTAPVPIRLSLDLDQASMELLTEVDPSLFARSEPARVPPAPVPGAPPPARARDRLSEALDRSTGELVPASARSAGGSHLVCPACQQAVRRRWDPHSDRYYFHHLHRPCLMESS